MNPDTPITIRKVDTHLQRTSYGVLALVMGLLFSALGLFFALMGFGYIPLYGKANAPLWIIGMVGISFAMAGLMLTVHALRGLIEKNRVRKLQQQFRGMPWMLDYPWDPTGIDDRPVARWVSALMGTLLLSVFLVPFNWWAYFSGEGPMMVKLIVGIFDIFIPFVFASFIYRFAQYLKYGSSRLSFTRFPFAAGEKIEVGFSPTLFTALKVTLRYVEEWFETTGHGRNRSVQHKTIAHWSEEQHFTPAPHSPEVKISFQLPDNREWVTQMLANPKIRYWELVVESEQPGVDFRTTFPLPVYDRPASRVMLPTPPQRSGTRRFLATPYVVELGLPLLLLAIMSLAWFVAPNQTSQITGSGFSLLERSKLMIALQPVKGIGSAAMHVERGPDGAIWVLEKYGVYRFRNDIQETLLDTQRYRALFPHKLNALSTFTVIGNDEAWIGSWYGELFHYRNGQWREISSRDAPLGRRIHSLAYHDNALYIAGVEGLNRWSEESGIERIDIPVGGASYSLAIYHDTLFAGIGNALWRKSYDVWELVWENTPGETIQSMLIDNDAIRLGTSNGIKTLDWTGYVRGHRLLGEQIHSISRHDNRLIAGSWNNGVWIEDGNGWLNLSDRTLPENSITGTVIDAHGTLWITQYGAGLSRAPFGRIIQYLKTD